MKYVVAVVAALVFTWIACLLFPLTIHHPAFFLGTFGVTWTMLVGVTCVFLCCRWVAAK